MLDVIKNKIHLTLFLTTLWQLISIGLVSVGVWPTEVVWINFILIALLIVGLPKIYAVGTFLLSLPFMVVLPESLVPNLPMWRPLVAWLFFVVAIKYLLEKWQANEGVVNYLRRIAKDFYKQKLNPWDKWLFALGGLMTLSLLAADFAGHGLKQIVFLVNAYVLYLAAVMAINHSDDWEKLRCLLQYSLLMTVVLGFVQYFATFLTEPYYFWQYWAMLVSSVYYGQPLAEVLAYSNSWFSAEGGNSSLRMFGILQDTHAFAVVAVFALGLWWSSARIKSITTRVRHILADQPKWYWVVLVLICFAIIASGTRGVWVAMVLPAIAILILIYRFKARLLGALPLLSYTIIILLFLISPFITAGFNWIRTMAQDDNILRRVTSVYDLSEASNVGRLEIWRESLKFSIHHPLGTGYGNFITSIVDVKEGASFAEVSEAINVNYNLPQKFVTAHSLYLHMLVELGILGVIVFALFWWSVAKQIWSAVIESEFAYSKLNLFFVATAIILLWLLAYGLFDVTILNERVLLYLMTILALLNMALRNRPKTLF